MTPPSTRALSTTLLLALLALPACRDPAQVAAQQAAIEQGKAAMAYWENKCKTVAGEKIYRKVEGVEGILLLKVRPKASDREWYDRNFPGAAFSRERQADEYIESFLGYEHGSTGPADRGYINSTPSHEPGYSYVDVIDEKDGTRYRYTVRRERDLKAKTEWWNVFLDRDPAPDPAPRYAVTYEDHVIAEERALGVASSTLKVIDTQNNEVLAERTVYAVTGGFDARSSTPPWLVAKVCPIQSGGASTETRLFADQVLIPARAEPK
ncbi:hypothetical protein OPU71_13915 [Niveibacterium sp. 24ML]|uniref:hypothetical protein n=1 Tax=Niveibacterium sp. 24ML TaxID=2985512 RepID=UPI00226FA25D|nr:hypothetical protein [Niveibacterium sp. 24ML]MCX9157223.1 hypothetical protein [Niveibacterium sp. 24ML]